MINVPTDLSFGGKISTTVSVPSSCRYFAKLNKYAEIRQSKTESKNVADAFNRSVDLNDLFSLISRAFNFRAARVLCG